MPFPSPFHDRTAPLCISYQWKDWAGCLAVRTYDHCHEREYFAVREGAGLFDVSPLYKYEVRGPDAAAFLSRVMTRNIRKLGVGRVTYCCWCDDEGKVVDDGTVSRLGDDHYRVTSADPSYGWFVRLARGFDVSLEDSSRAFAALALQGPRSREILRGCSDAAIDELRFFGTTGATIDGTAVQITRTGYTGDLGYEIWMPNDGAVPVWDAIIDAGRDHGIEPAGLDALDLTRIEAGFIMLEVDYYSSVKEVLASRKSSPFELGLGWTVNLGRGPFIGERALTTEKAAGSEWQLVGIEASWEGIEALYESYGLPPNLPAAASREPLPVFADGKQVGRMTSHAWSPLLKRSIGLASVRSSHAAVGTLLEIEHTVEFERRTVPASVVKMPFYDPERKRRP